MRCDSVVATDFDEGGTFPDMTLGTFSIVPLIADAVKSIPVMAAGGNCDSLAFEAAVLAANAKDLPLFRIR